MLEPTPVPSPLPVACFYILRPSEDGAPIAIVERETPSTRSLVESSFPRYLSSPGHQQRKLDLCAELAQTVPRFAVEFPEKCRARDVAARVLAHCQTLCGPVRP